MLPAAVAVPLRLCSYLLPSNTNLRYTYYREQCRFCGAERLLLAMPLKQQRRAVADAAPPWLARYF